jgi:hypothetical protein
MHGPPSLDAGNSPELAALGCWFLEDFSRPADPAHPHLCHVGDRRWSNSSAWSASTSVDAKIKTLCISWRTPEGFRFPDELLGVDRT